MFLNSYLSADHKNKELVDNFYQKIVNISRNKTFYENYLVPDTIDGRFDLLALFSIILTYFLSKSGSKGQIISQILFDKIFLDLDLSLRELGAGDTGVNIKIRNMVESYMGRQKVYCQCLEINDYELLKKFIIKNVYRNVENYKDSPNLLKKYCKITCLLFHKQKNNFLLLDQLDFPNI